MLGSVVHARNVVQVVGLWMDTGGVDEHVTQTFAYAKCLDCKRVVGLNTKHPKGVITANRPMSGHAHINEIEVPQQQASRRLQGRDISCLKGALETNFNPL